MKSEDKNLYEYLMDMKGQLTIPIYQRNFAWEEKDYSTLLEDILDSPEGHWIDRIVTKHFNKDKKANEYYEIHLIDGQQRLTTILTLFTAICAYCKNNKIQGIDYEDIYESVLINPRYKKDKKYKLKPTHEYGFFKEIVDNLPDEKMVYKSKSKIRAMYNYFYLNLNPDNIFDLWDNIREVEIIDVVCENNDDGSKIFGNINFKGVQLTDHEIIRNLSLMNLNPEEQVYYNDKCWNVLINHFHNKKNKFNSFFSFFMIYKKETWNAAKMTKSKINKYYFKNNNEKKFFEDIMYFFDKYKMIMEKKYYKDDEISQKLEEMLPNNYEQLIPIFCKIFDYYEKGYCTKKELLVCLELIKVHSTRMIIAKSTAPHFRFNIKSIHEDAVLISCYKMLTKNIPEINNERFKQDIKRYNFYRRGSTHGNKLVKEFLYQLEHYNHSNERMARNPKATIEHIMPQKLTEEWKEYLGENAEDVHEQHLNKLGNLTLAYYNSNLSNKSFDDKKYMEDGFCHDRSYLSKDICKYEKWDEKAIKDRREKLAEQLCEIYSYPNVYQTF